MNSTLKHPSAWIPLAMSLTALVWLLANFVVVGVVHEADEGLGAHVWQILMAGQLPFIAFFAVKWLPTTPKPAVMVLGLQLITFLAACFPVFYFKL
jgi:hypothetical protein